METEWAIKNCQFAHYTTLAAVENILKTGEIWASSPATLNDRNEIVKFFNDCVSKLWSNKIFHENENGHKFIMSVMKYHNSYNEHFKNAYIFSTTLVVDLSAHIDSDLSQWIAYGDNGKGAALIIDLKKMNIENGSPILMGLVDYLNESEYNEHSNKFIDNFVSDLELLNNTSHSDDFYYWNLTNEFFSELIEASLFKKSHSFGNEKEFRIAYIPRRDFAGRFRQSVDYCISDRDIKTVFKYDIKRDSALSGHPVNFEDIVTGVIIGPCLNSEDRKLAVEVMVEKLRPNSNIKVIKSTLPYRGR